MSFGESELVCMFGPRLWAEMLNRLWGGPLERIRNDGYLSVLRKTEFS
jgi:hypothetical protein